MNSFRPIQTFYSSIHAHTHIQTYTRTQNQRDIGRAYGVESNILSAMVSTLPTATSGYYNQGAGATGELSGTDAFYEWMQGVLTDVFSDPVCGECQRMWVCCFVESYTFFIYISSLFVKAM